MLKMSNIDEYQKLSKEQLIELAKMYGRFALTLDGLWFLGVERIIGTEEAIKLDENVWRQFGKSEAKILKRFLSINIVSTLEDICKIYLLTPVYGNLGGKADIRGRKCYLAVTDCLPQKPELRKILENFLVNVLG